jgi:hypothetical protein
MDDVRDFRVKHFGRGLARQATLHPLRPAAPRQAQVAFAFQPADTKRERSWGTTPFDSAAAEEPNVRTFSCFIFDEQSSIPTLSFIFAADELQARMLACRELMEVPRPASVELCEGDKLVWAEKAQGLGWVEAH